MPLFGRKKSTGSSQDDAEARDEQDVVTSDEAQLEEGDADDTSAGVPDSDEARRRRSRLRPREDVDLSNGPYDSADAPEGERLDFGAIALTPPDDADLRLDVDEKTQVITGVTAVFGPESAGAVQIQVFAAPKTSGIWYGIRREIADALVAGGGTADEVDGVFGTELHCRMPGQGPDGRTTFAPVRFIGVDGPRWFLRAVFSGTAALDDEMAARAMDVVRSVVVHRGGDARAPRELLELTLPPELLAQIQQNDDGQQAPAVATGPLERGPEIAETR